MTFDPGEKFRSTQLQFDYLDSVLDGILDDLDDLFDPEEGCGDCDDPETCEADCGNKGCDEPSCD